MRGGDNVSLQLFSLRLSHKHLILSPLYPILFHASIVAALFCFCLTSYLKLTVRTYLMLLCHVVSFPCFLSPPDLSLPSKPTLCRAVIIATFLCFSQSPDQSLPSKSALCLPVLMLSFLSFSQPPGLKHTTTPCLMLLCCNGYSVLFPLRG